MIVFILFSYVCQHPPTPANVQNNSCAIGDPFLCLGVKQLMFLHAAANCGFFCGGS